MLIYSDATSVTLDLTAFFKAQDELDYRCVVDFNLIDDYNLFRKRVIALFVELGEFTNDWRGFKFWSTDTSPREGMLEELIDVFHFVLGVGVYLNRYLGLPKITTLTVQKVYKAGTDAEIETMVLNLMQDVLSVFNAKSETAYNRLLTNFFILVQLLQIPFSDIEHAYKSKNLVNHQRLSSGY